MQLRHARTVLLGLITAAVAIIVPPSLSQAGDPTASARPGGSDLRRSRHRAPRPPSPQPRGNFGDPLPGLTAAQMDDFAEGVEEFGGTDTAESGLGPIFNNTGCGVCHAVPVMGGSSQPNVNFVTRFGRSTQGNFDALDALGGSLLQSDSIDPRVREIVPHQANVTAKRITTPLFGAGLVEAIPDSAIMQSAARSKPDGVSGKVSTVLDAATGQTRIGRFGWKAQHANLLTFAADAYVNEMGITNRIFPHENAPNGNMQLLAEYDKVADPEDQTDPVSNKADIDKFADFMRLLGPPPRGTLTDNARIGALLFVDAGCAHCHTPVLFTGPNPIAVLDRKPVALFSDLLLHDMGSLGDGIVQGSASGREIKTSLLWGAGARTVYLHDGRAASLDAAIRLHDGEAARARDRYKAFPARLQSQLQEFLRAI